MRDTTKPLRSGDLRHTVTLHAPAGTRAVAASDVQTGVPAAIGVVPPSFQAREAIAVGGLRTSTQYMVSLRYRTDVLASDVIQEECCTQRVFQIQSIIPSDRRDAVDMMCVTNG